MALKLSWYFYLLVEKPLIHYFQVWSLYYTLYTVQPENTYSCILKVIGQARERQKRISIYTNYSYHQHSSPEASLNWSNNIARFSFNQPSRKRLGVKLVSVKHLPHKAFLSWDHHKNGGQPRPKRQPLHEVTNSVTNPVF